MRLNRNQAEALQDLAEIASRRHTIEAEIRMETQRLRDRLYETYNTDLGAALSRCTHLGVPKTRMARAYGTKNTPTITNLIAELATTAPEPTNTNTTEHGGWTFTPGTDTAHPTVVLAGEAEPVPLELQGGKYWRPHRELASDTAMKQSIPLMRNRDFQAAALDALGTPE